MPLVTDPRCPLVGTVPAPRVVQNQLDRNLENYMALCEHLLLPRLQRAMRYEREHRWIAVFVTVVIILHTRERDLWRLVQE